MSWIIVGLLLYLDIQEALNLEFIGKFLISIKRGYIRFNISIHIDNIEALNFIKSILMQVIDRNKYVIDRESYS